MTENSGFCPVYDSIELLQEKWVLHVIRALLDAPRGFNDLQRAVGGVNSTTLARRLEELERLDIVSKSIESTMPPRTHYELTLSGQELSQVIDAIDSWARNHFVRCREIAETHVEQPHDASSSVDRKYPTGV